MPRTCADHTGRHVPTCAAQMDLTGRKERLEKKRLHLQELLTQQISFKCLGPDRPIRHLATRRDPRNSLPRAPSPS